MTKKKAARTKKLKAELSREPEIGQVSRQLAALALAQIEQDGQLSVRQTEQLRRTFARAGNALGWNVMAVETGTSVADVSNDVMVMAQSGADFMAADLKEALAAKRTEMARIRKAATAARDLVDRKEDSFPTEITYSYTARDSSQALITKTETVTVNAPEEAPVIANTIEKNITGRGKLNDLMIIDLEHKRGQLGAMSKKLPDFLTASHGLLREVIANLQ